MSGTLTTLRCRRHPRYWPDESGGTGEGASHPPLARAARLRGGGAGGPVAEAQIEVGMRPSVLTPTGWYRPLSDPAPPATALSLVHEWQQVRRWRQSLVSESVDRWAEVLHAHCFAAAMAGLRGSVAGGLRLVAPDRRRHRAPAWGMAAALAARGGTVCVVARGGGGDPFARHVVGGAAAWRCRRGPVPGARSGGSRRVRKSRRRVDRHAAVTLFAPDVRQ